MFGQETIKSESFIVYGTILEIETNQPLEYATIILKNTETQKITGGITDKLGNFNIQTPKGIYDISVEFISFKTKKFHLQNITASKNLGIIKLEENGKDLDEIIVISEKSTIDLRLDKKIYNIGKDMTVKGGTASDVLDNVPAVNIDPEGTISLRGNESVRILIDGKPSELIGLNDVNALRQLPSDAIEKVEVITSPSARYDSEGTAGIINIILRKGKTSGFNGSANATLGDPKNYQTALNLNLRSNKINLFSNLSYNDGGSPGIFDSNITYLTNKIIDSTRIENRVYDRNRKSLNANVGLEYSINESSSITANIFLKDSNEQNISSNTIGSFDDSDNNLYNSIRIQDEREKNKTSQFSLNYVNNFNKKGQQLTIDIQHSESRENESAVITDIYPETTATDRFSEKQLIQSDYILPIGENAQFEMGYRGNFENLIADYVVIAPNLDPRFNPSNKLDFVQKINAYYTQFGNKVNNFTYLLGMRVEMTQIDIKLINSNQNFNKKYTNLFPTANIGYKISKERSLTLGYNRRLRRPRSRALNPFENRASEILFYKGNVNLDPTYSDSFDLGYLNKWEKLTFNSSIYYQHSTNNIVRVNSQEIRVINDKETSIIVRVPINLASEDRVGFEFTTNYTANNRVKLSGSFNFFQFETKGEYSYDTTNPITNTTSTISQNFDAKNTSWFTRFDAKITFPWEIQSQTRILYTGPRNDAQSEVDGLLSVNLAFSKDLFKRKATLVLNINDLFNSRKYNFKNYAPSKENPTNISDQTYQRRIRQISLNFSYRWNQKKKIKKRNSDEINDF
ncbi:MAG: TonB-dependent receptor [Polaribacter sp.]|nr:TonB-dependent receptor [Polaribacter sp.]